ncbi:unnamed protein product [Rotaria sp. Silwood2]|nr:unnamed protein product [Rotaria sp. Silwood2]
MINHICTSNFLSPTTTTIISSKESIHCHYRSYLDSSFDSSLFAYCLSKCYPLLNENGILNLSKVIRFPILSGFFSTHLTLAMRSFHSLTFCTPIKQNPNDIATTENCLSETKTLLLESNYQKEAVLVVDEKLYHNCIKVIRNNPTRVNNIFIYPGDFHLMKTTMIAMWQILEGSGIEDILSFIYKGATLKSIFNVFHFNKSFRCCKLLYTTLKMLLIESYITSNTTTTSTSNYSFLPSAIRLIFENIPHEFNVDAIKQTWFKSLITAIEQENLLSKIILYNFYRYDRIDIVFNSRQSQKEKSFISNRTSATISCSYEVKCDDFICSDYQQLIKNNPAVVAARVRECWCTDAYIQTLPTGKILVIAGPDDSSVTLRKNHAPTEDYLLVSNHIYACTRSFIHAHAISFENIKSVAFQSSDADIALLAISHGLYLDVDNIYVKSFNTNAKFDIFINTREISINIKEKRSVDPIILIVIHALSGYEAISTAERLLLDSYSLKYTPSSLDEHRAIMASTAFKDNRSSCIALALPPSSNAFYFHCQRVARQSQIWFQAYQSDMSIQSIENNEGYEVIQNEVKIKWLSKNSIPLDHRLSVCGKCFGNCNRCVCGKNNVVCTLLCKCSAEKCKNRTHASSSQNCNLSEILLNDVTRDINFNQSTYDFNTIDSIDKEDGKASQSSFASNCSSYTENTDDDFPHLYQSSEESLSSTADWESTDSNSCSITNIDHSHSNRFNDKTKEKSVASEKRNNTINRSLSEFQQMGLSRIKIIQFKTIKSSNIGSESSFNIRSPSTTPLSQPLTSTPLTFRIKKAHSQQVIRKENYDSFENNTPPPLNFNFVFFVMSQKRKETNAGGTITNFVPGKKKKSNKFVLPEGDTMDSFVRKMNGLVNNGKYSRVWRIVFFLWCF